MMRYCSKCGKELPDTVKYCPECGAMMWGFNEEPPRPSGTNQYRNADEGIGLWIFLGALISWFTLLGGVILAIVMYACGQPERGKGVLIGVGVAIVLAVVLVLFVLLLIGASYSGAMI